MYPTVAFPNYYKKRASKYGSMIATSAIFMSFRTGSGTLGSQSLDHTLALDTRANSISVGRLPNCTYVGTSPCHARAISAVKLESTMSKSGLEASNSLVAGRMELHYP